MCYHFAMIRFSVRIRTCLAASLAVILASGCNRSDEPQGEPGPSVVPTPAVAIPVAARPLDRRALLLAVVEAGSAAATGLDDGESQRKLEGKPFEMRLRFGCEGPGGAGDSGSGVRSSWSFNEERRILRIRFSPDLDAGDPEIAGLASGPFEAVEGFRVLRPWLLTAACPVAAVSPPSPGPTGDASPSPTEGSSPIKKSPAAKTSAPADSASSADAGPEWSPPFVGIAQFFTEQDARTHRRASRAYEVTKTLKVDEQPSARGYDLLLSGRLKRRGDGKVITCTLAGGTAPPSCVISVDFDHVAIIRADTGEQLARWTTG
jgi:hypothetical protein